MKYENLTHSQKSIYDKLEKQIKDAIKDLENKIIAFSNIEYFPKKLTERLNTYKEELNKLPYFFENAIKISNYLVTEINKTGEFSFIHNFYYNNFENKDVYLLCNLKNK